MNRWAYVVALVGMVALIPTGWMAAQAQVCETETCTKRHAPPPGLTAEELPDNLEPAVVELGYDPQLIGDRMYQRIAGPTPVMASPGGEVTREMPPGFTFVTTQGTEADYTQINPDEWVASSSLTPIWPSTFSGVLMDEPLVYPMAWLLRYVVPSTSPGVEPPEDGNPLPRYQPVYIFSYEMVDGWRWYQIGPDQWIEQTSVAKVLPIPRPADVDTDRWVSVDLYEQVAIAYEGDKPVFATLVSSGMADWPTNEGLFHVYYRNPRAPMSGANAQPDFYDLEEVPWTMYFDNDIALHGAYWHDGFGYRRSHGCVNLSITDAHWLYQWAAPEFDSTVPDDTGIAVYVYSSGIYR
ncbi:MAG: L,D-transpeptidase [Anaerolineae bacterium]